MPEPEAGNWDDYRFALAVFRAGTVSAAARQLGVDHATVIRRIERLERGLGEALFQRRASGYVPTEAGHHVAATADAVESAIINGQGLVARAAARLTGTVRIGAPDGFGSSFLAPRLGSLVERHPELDIQLVATARLFSLSKREADIAIGLSLPQEGRIVGRKLTDYHLKLYAAPDYLARFPPIAAGATSNATASSATSRNCCTRRNSTTCSRSRPGRERGCAAPTSTPSSRRRWRDWGWRCFPASWRRGGPT